MDSIVSSAGAAAEIPVLKLDSKETFASFQQKFGKFKGVKDITIEVASGGQLILSDAEKVSIIADAKKKLKGPV